MPPPVSGSPPNWGFWSCASCGSTAIWCRSAPATGQLGATVVQPCVVTLAPVVTRIEEPVGRSFVAGWEPPQGDEVELPEDVDTEPLGTAIDLGAIMVEALALALPAWPRAEGADLDEAVFTEPGKAPMTDDDAKPFAGLAALRDKLSKDTGDD